MAPIRPTGDSKLQLRSPSDLFKHESSFFHFSPQIAQGKERENTDSEKLLTFIASPAFTFPLKSLLRNVLWCSGAVRRPHPRSTFSNQKDLLLPGLLSSTYSFSLHCCGKGRAGELTLAGQKVPGTQTPWAQGPCLEKQNWAPLASYPASHPCSHSPVKGANMSCPSDGAAGKLYSKAHLFFSIAKKL